MEGLAVETEGLVKVYGDTRAVDGIDLRIPRGGVHGFLGPNGAGKTTAIRMLATLIRPDAGSARVLGKDVLREADAVRSLVGLTGQFASVDEDLSGLENLRLIARLYGYRGAAATRRSMELLEAFGLDDAVEDADALVPFAPDHRGEIGDARNWLFKMWRPHVRELGAAEGGRESVASSAVRRRDEDPAYDPANLAAYLDGDHRVTDV